MYCPLVTKAFIELSLTTRTLKFSLLIFVFSNNGAVIILKVSSISASLIKFFPKTIFGKSNKVKKNINMIFFMISSR